MTIRKILIASTLALLATSSAFARDSEFSKEQIARLPQEKVQIIRQHCAKDWPDDFHMRLVCEDEQYTALMLLIARSGEEALEPPTKGAKTWTHTLSAKCQEEISQHRATSECQKEGEQWSAEMTEKLNDPEWRNRLTKALSGK